MKIELPKIILSEEGKHGCTMISFEGIVSHPPIMAIGYQIIGLISHTDYSYPRE